MARESKPFRDRNPAVIGAISLGVILALPIDGISTTFANTMTFSTMAINFRVTTPTVIQALGFAAAMGLLGGWLPARQAMRMSVVDALRTRDRGGSPTRDRASWSAKTPDFVDSQPG